MLPPVVLIIVFINDLDNETQCTLSRLGDGRQLEGVADRPLLLLDGHQQAEEVEKQGSHEVQENKEKRTTLCTSTGWCSCGEK